MSKVRLLARLGNRPGIRALQDAERLWKS